MAEYAAIDFGASTGRVLTGALRDGRVLLTERHRFQNAPVRSDDGLHWNLSHLFNEAVDGLRGVGSLKGVGVDTWGVDYALLDGRHQVLGVPFHYRDGRGDAQVERAFRLRSREEQYAVTGIQTLPFNTVFQLMAEAPARLETASRIALMPDLVGLWLSGELANERTNASTTGLLDARSGEWAHELIGALGLPRGLFGELVEPGTALGVALPEHGIGPVPVRTVASHDTASAFVAAPVRDEHAAILSSGTWSLLGLELPGPVLGDAAREANLTNERGFDGTTRLLKNVMGLWLEQECAREWGMDHASVFAAAAREVPGGPLFDPDLDALLAPGDMSRRIAVACESGGQSAPDTPGATARSILDSLACKYRFVLERLEAVSGRDVRRIHVIGGGARVRLLCQLTADITGREVLAGPVEATAMGNVLVQARAVGDLESLSEMREVAAASAEIERYEPSLDRGLASEIYRSFLDRTGLVTPAHA